MMRVKQMWNAGAVAGRVRAALAAQNRANALDLAKKAAEQAPAESPGLKDSLKPYGAGSRFAESDGGLHQCVGSNLPDAAAAHERTDTPHPLGGKAKYLEDPLQENKALYLQKLADAAERAMKV